MPLRAFLVLSRLAGETWLASGRTIAHRSRMLVEAAGDPAALGDPEFSRMGHEKLAVAIEGAVALAAALPALQYRWSAWWLDQGFRAASAMVTLPGAAPLELARAHASFLDGVVAAQQSFGTALTRDGIKLATAALRPVHRTASGNSRRLHRQRSFTSVGAGRHRL